MIQTILNRTTGMRLTLLVALFFAGNSVMAAPATASPWVNENPEYAQGRHGEALRFDFWRSHLFFKAPGYFSQQSGTIQFWIKPLSEIADLVHYSTILSSTSTQKQHKFAQLEMTICPAGDSRAGALFAGINSQTPGSVLFKLPWKKGEWHALALTWDSNGIRLYSDGEIAAAQNGKAVAFDVVPELLSFGGGTYSRYPLTGKCLIDEIEISDCSRSPAYIKKFAASRNAPQPDEHTLALNHCDKDNSSDYWKMTPTYRAQSSPLAVPGSSFLTDYRIFPTGNTIKLPVTLVNPLADKHDFQVTAAIGDYWGKPVAEIKRQYSLEAGTIMPVILSPEIAAPGWYKYALRVNCGSKEILKSEHSFVVLPSYPAGFIDFSDYFGNHLSGTRKTDMFTQAGIPWERDMASFTWSRVEPERGNHDWRAADFAVKDAEKNHQKLIAVLGHSPYWAGQGPEHPENWKNALGVKQYSAHMPRNLEEFADYVYQTVSRYKGKITYWEIWNEPDWNQPNMDGVSFTGTNQQYLSVLKTAYAAAKKANPDCRIITGGFVPHEHLLKYLKANHGENYFDILGMHRYRPWENFLQYRSWFSDKACWQTEKMVIEPFEICSEAMRARSSGVAKYFYFDAMTAMTDFKGNGGFEACGWDPQPLYFATAHCAQKMGDRNNPVQLQFDGYANLNRSLVFDAGTPNQLAAVFFDYKGPGKIRISFTAKTGSKLTLTSLMGRQQQIIVGNSGKVETTIEEMLFIEGPCNPASFRVEAFGDGSLLSNSDFSQIDGDLGVDKLAGVKLKNWTFRDREENGRIEVKQGNEGSNEVCCTWGGKGFVRLDQEVCFPMPGTYRLSADFKCTADKPDQIVAQFLLYNPLTQGCSVKDFSGEINREYRNFAIRFTIRPGEEHMKIALGIVRGQGQLYIRNPVLVKAIDNNLLQQTMIVDLKPYVNQSFGDDVKGDGKGGWADLGADNLIMMKSGVREFNGKIFRIIGPAEVESQKACIMLGSPMANHLPNRVDDIRLGAKLKRLDFLHTAMYVSAKPGETLGEYVIHYSDGSTISHPLLRGTAIDDWYQPTVNPKIKIAEEVYAPSGLSHVVFTDEWINPFPDKEITSIDLRGNNKAILAIIAISGQKNN